MTWETLREMWQNAKTIFSHFLWRWGDVFLAPGAWLTGSPTRTPISHGWKSPQVLVTMAGWCYRVKDNHQPAFNNYRWIIWRSKSPTSTSSFRRTPRQQCRTCRSTSHSWRFQPHSLRCQFRFWVRGGHRIFEPAMLGAAPAAFVVSHALLGHDRYDGEGSYAVRRKRRINRRCLSMILRITIIIETVIKSAKSNQKCDLGHTLGSGQNRQNFVHHPAEAGAAILLTQLLPAIVVLPLVAGSTTVRGPCEGNNV